MWETTGERHNSNQPTNTAKQRVIGRQCLYILFFFLIFIISHLFCFHTDTRIHSHTQPLPVAISRLDRPRIAEVKYMQCVCVWRACVCVWHVCVCVCVRACVHVCVCMYVGVCVHCPLHFINTTYCAPINRAMDYKLECPLYRVELKDVMHYKNWTPRRRIVHLRRDTVVFLFCCLREMQLGLIVKVLWD